MTAQQPPQDDPAELLKRYAPGGVYDNGPINPFNDPYKHLRPKPAPKEVQAGLEALNKLRQDWGQK